MSKTFLLSSWLVDIINNLNQKPQNGGKLTKTRGKNRGGRGLPTGGRHQTARRHPVPTVGNFVNGADWTALATGDGSGGDVTVYDPQRQPLHLKRSDCLAHGGGGAVYHFKPSPNILIKVCKASQQKELAAKVQAMLELEECRKAPFLAWPLMPVFDAGGKVNGFAMRRCSGRTLRALYAPIQVKRFFPGWDKLHTAQVALKLVNGVQLLARHGVLINDFNPDNFLINPSGEVQFIDCDSFQISKQNGKDYLANTFMPEFAAPELVLHPENFRYGRTPEQIRFSLAIVTYMIIMSGLHPYARVGGSDPVENLRSGRCPLNPSGRDRFPVSWNKAVSWLPDSLLEYFRKMFVDGHSDPKKRPMIGELKTELENYIGILRTSRENDNQRAILPTTSKRRKRK